MSGWRPCLVVVHAQSVGVAEAPRTDGETRVRRVVGEGRRLLAPIGGPWVVGETVTTTVPVEVGTGSSHRIRRERRTRGEGQVEEPNDSREQTPTPRGVYCDRPLLSSPLPSEGSVGTKG